jgi:hypothetical protein
MKDGLYRVNVGGVCGGFEVYNGVVVSCAPILRRFFNFWVKFSELVPTTTATHLRNGAETKHNMPEVTETDSHIIDLGFDVTAEDVMRPVLQGGPVSAEIAFVRLEPSRVKGTMQYKIGYRTTQETKDINGRTINPGFTLIQSINQKPSGKQTQKMIDDQLKRIHFAACGLGKATTAEWVGKPVSIVVRLREPHTNEDGTSYDASNDIAGVNPVKKAA